MHDAMHTCIRACTIARCNAYMFTDMCAAAACVRLQLALCKFMQSKFLHDFAKIYIEIIDPAIR